MTEVQAFSQQFRAIVDDARSLTAALRDEAFNWQPAAGRWSVGQCLEHLNVTDRKMLENMQPRAEALRASAVRARGPLRHGWFMRWFIADMEPPLKRKYQTGQGFVPSAQLSRVEVMSDFAALHDEVQRLLEAVDGYDLKAVKVQSPFLKLLRYPLGSAFALMAAHDRRHLWQAREVMREYTAR